MSLLIITARVTDPEGRTAEAEVTVDVADLPPVVEPSGM